MKILIEYASGASYWVRNAWRKVFECAGHKVFMWCKDNENINDAEVRVGNIDIFLGNTYNVDRSVDKFIRRHPNMKVALFGSNWGDLTDPIDTKVFPIIKVTEDEKKILGKLYNDTQKPDLIHIHVHDEFLEPCMGGWKTLGIPIAGIMNGADTFVYHNVKPQQKYLCDVGLTSGYWPYKAVNLDKFIVRLCNEEWQNINIKIFGNGWNIPQYLGSLPEGEDAVAMASASISPTISEPHSVVYGYDVVERTFKVPLTGSLLISDNVESVDTLFGHCCPIYDTYEEFKELIYFYGRNDSIRKDMAHKQKRIVLNNHTYFHRMHKLLNNLKLPNEAEHLLKSYNP